MNFILLDHKIFPIMCCLHQFGKTEMITDRQLKMCICVLKIKIQNHHCCQQHLIRKLSLNNKFTEQNLCK